jgi:hypothetical protein
VGFVSARLAVAWRCYHSPCFILKCCTFNKIYKNNAIILLFNTKRYIPVTIYGSYYASKEIMLLLKWIIGSWNSSVIIVSVQTGRPGFDPRYRQGIFHLTCVLPALRPTQIPIKLVAFFFSGAKARLGRDADHSSPSSADVKNE